MVLPPSAFDPIRFCLFGTNAKGPRASRFVDTLTSKQLAARKKFFRITWARNNFSMLQS
jgi:hypothetical protein